MGPLKTAVVLLVYASLSACASATRQQCTDHQRRGVQDTLYFGTTRPNRVVSDQEWSQFLQSTVTPRFPHGLTVFAAAGQWLGATGVPVRESTHVLQIVHPDSAANDVLMTEIIAAYESSFTQEAVLRTKVLACFSF